MSNGETFIDLNPSFSPSNRAHFCRAALSLSGTAEWQCHMSARPDNDLGKNTGVLDAFAAACVQIAVNSGTATEASSGAHAQHDRAAESWGLLHLGSAHLESILDGPTHSSQAQVTSRLLADFSDKSGDVRPRRSVHALPLNVIPLQNPLKPWCDIPRFLEMAQVLGWPGFRVECPQLLCYGLETPYHLAGRRRERRAK